MRDYCYKKAWQKLLTPEIVTMLTQIHEYKGKQSLFYVAQKDVLDQLMDAAKIQSTESSNEIEGIYTSDHRLKLLVKDKTRPQNRNEEEIAGYRDVLNAIHVDYPHIPVKPSIILQLHRDLYKFEGYDIGGRYKTGDNIIEKIDEHGQVSVRFQSVASCKTAESVEKLCQAFEEAVVSENIDMLLLMPMFILDFLCIHPFHDGNGRMSRLLTLLLLYRSDYMVGKYISIEKQIKITKASYYAAFQQSSQDWHENHNDYEPFTRYMLGVLLGAYREFSTRVEQLAIDGMSKSDRVRKVIQDTLGTITKAEILAKCPNISQVTVQRALSDLIAANMIRKIGGGRYTKYTWNRENEK